MKTLSEYVNEKLINENLLHREDFFKHNYKYSYTAVDLLLNNEVIHLGSRGQDGECSINDFDRKKLEELKSYIINKDKGLSYQSFNDCINQDADKKIRWTNLCKFDVRKVAIGQGNLGEEFEKEYINDLLSENSSYKEELIKTIQQNKKYKNIPIPLNPETVLHQGTENNRRPLKIRSADNALVVSNTQEKSNKIGSIIADIKIVPTKNEEDNIYLSLKEGKPVSFINCGLRNDDFFKNTFKENGNTGELGKKLLHMLCIKEDLFKEIFLNYNPNKKLSKSKAGVQNVSILDKIKENETEIKEFLKSAIGYGYILIHNMGNKCHYYDLRTEQQMNDFIGIKGNNFIKSATLNYSIGNFKRIKCILETDNLKLTFNIRNSANGVFPSHLYVEYEYLKNN